MKHSSRKVGICLRYFYLTPVEHNREEESKCIFTTRHICTQQLLYEIYMVYIKYTWCVYKFSSILGRIILMTVWSFPEIIDCSVSKEMLLLYFGLDMFSLF
jgi:hypothetical protein